MKGYFVVFVVMLRINKTKRVYSSISTPMIYVFSSTFVVAVVATYSYILTSLSISATLVTSPHEYCHK